MLTLLDTIIYVLRLFLPFLRHRTFTEVLVVGSVLPHGLYVSVSPSQRWRGECNPLVNPDVADARCATVPRAYALTAGANTTRPYTQM